MKMKKIIIAWCVLFVVYMALWWLQYDNKDVIHTNEKGIHRSIMIAQLKLCGLYKKLDIFYQQFPITPVVPINWKVTRYANDTIFTSLGDTSYIDTDWNSITSDTIPVFEYYVDCDTIIMLKGGSR